jgi:hypothetical protein
VWPLWRLGLWQKHLHSGVGVRQGKTLSPFLFALFFNDLDIFLFLSTHNVDSLATISDAIEEELIVMIKIQF